MTARKISKSYNKPIFDYRVLKFLGILMLIWPIDKNKKYFHRILREMCWWLLMVNDISLLCGVGIGFYLFYDDIPTFSTIIFIIEEITVISEIIYTTINFKIRRLNIKTLINVVEKTACNVNSKEEILLREYMKTSILTSLLQFVIATTMTILYTYLLFFEPMLVLPKEIWHPFPINPYYKKSLMIIQQLIFLIRIGLLHVPNGIVFMSMSVATARLQVLADELARVTNNFELTKCIRQHQEIIWFVNEINSTMRIMLLKTVLFTASYLIGAFLQIFYVQKKVNYLLMYQFTMATLISIYRLYFNAQCADNLSTMSENLRFSIPLPVKSSGISKSTCTIIIQRCQRPIGISVCGIMPHFDLEYYGKFLSLTFSYFLTTKAILELKTGF